MKISEEENLEKIKKVKWAKGEGSDTVLFFYIWNRGGIEMKP